MKNKLEILFTLLTIALILKIFFFDIDEIKMSEKINVTYSLYLFLFVLIINIIITYLFHCIIKIISENKIGAVDTLQIFLQGGVINQLIPSAGYIFKYYKFKNNSNINLAEYSISQSIFSISSLISYTLVGFAFGLFYISNVQTYKILVLLSLFSIFTFIAFKLRFRIVQILKNFVKNIRILNNIIDDISKIFYILKYNTTKFFYIFCGFIILTFLECFAFYLLLELFEIKISFFLAASLWIATSLISVLAIINFFGLFEAILALSALIVFDENVISMLVIGFVFRFFYLFSQILLIIFSYFIKLFNKMTTNVLDN